MSRCDHRSICSSCEDAVNASLATTAGALIALVAVATLMTAAPALRAQPFEARTLPAETQTVRSVAAAVAAAAREMIASERLIPDVSLAAGQFAVARVIAPATVIDPVGAAEFISYPQIISERLLIDLPPPGRWTVGQ